MLPTVRFVGIYSRIYISYKQGNKVQLSVGLLSSIIIYIESFYQKANLYERYSLTKNNVL